MPIDQQIRMVLCLSHNEAYRRMVLYLLHHLDNPCTVSFSDRLPLRRLCREPETLQARLSFYFCGILTSEKNTLGRENNFTFTVAHHHTDARSTQLRNKGSIDIELDPACWRQLHTTGEASIADCLNLIHSAKQHKHSANLLPSVALGKEETAKKGRQRFLCRVFFVGHSVKTLPSA
jgi:hypothetical protein